jgi:hypothetical protein
MCCLLTKVVSLLRQSPAVLPPQSQSQRQANAKPKVSDGGRCCFWSFLQTPGHFLSQAQELFNIYPTLIDRSKSSFTFSRPYPTDYCVLYLLTIPATFIYPSLRPEVSPPRIPNLTAPAHPDPNLPRICQHPGESIRDTKKHHSTNTSFKFQSTCARRSHYRPSPIAYL